MPTENRSSNIEIAKILSPFAAVADCYSDAEDDSFEPARDRGQHKDLALTLGQFRAVRALLDHPMACRHEWTDDGEWQLTCTKCGAQENHEPYGWVQTRGPAINQFTQEWDIVQEWEDQGFQYKAMHDHPAPVDAEEVARLRAELADQVALVDWWKDHLAVHLAILFGTSGHTPEEAELSADDIISRAERLAPSKS
ncbi:hypothetical protein [Pseudomonas putida]|uniref:Uncharacterized protein n=1 Tax=Pseudomonas putida TaxID=303 RepID=A0A1Q9QZP7_PSEPU|nr:hypothetical protein [Pseudomonas putida]OLS60595.1 hypothetical protein PSEMO_45680 [Pseudomonas putida]